MRTIALVLCAAAVALAGCTTPEPDAAPPTGQSTEDQPATPRPKDRDGDAVLAALRELDLCALLEKAGLPAGARPVATQPFECQLTGTAGISVTAINIDHLTRVESASRTVGGAKAYVRQGGNCYVDLPVSFTTALEFSQGPGTGCEDVTNLAAAAAEVLANPDAVRAKPVWDACSALASAFDADVDRTKLQGNGPADCTNHSREPTPASISFADDLPPSDEQQPPETTTIGDTQARVYEEEGNCEVYWRQRPFESRHARSGDYQVVARTPDCDQSKDLADALTEVLAAAPPTDTAPQRPLLYGPDEQDSPYPGACAYVDEPDPKRCEPYAEVPVPEDPTEILTAVSDDADVQCALSAKAVGAHFGTELQPVAESDNGTRCIFVEPQRRVQLTFSVSYGKVFNESDGKPATVAGHPGFLAADQGSFRFDLSSTGELDGEGTVTLVVAAGPAVTTGPPPDTKAKAEAVLADVLEEHFS